MGAMVGASMRGLAFLMAALLVPALAVPLHGAADAPQGDPVPGAASASATAQDGPSSPGVEAVWRDTLGSYACMAWSCVLVAGDPAPDHTFPTPDGHTEATFTVTWSGPAEVLRLTVESDDRVRSVAGAPGTALTMPLGDTFTVTVADASPFSGTGARGGSVFAVEMAFA